MATAQFSFDAVTLDTQGIILPSAPVYEAQVRNYNTGDTPPAWPASLPTQTSREFTIPFDIVGGTSLDCRVRVTAAGYDGSSDWSNVITGMPCDVVINPTNVIASSGANSVTIDWDDGGPGLIEVELQEVRPTQGAWGNKQAPTETIYTWGGLPSGRAYKARVRYVHQCAGATLTSDWIETNVVRTCPEISAPTISSTSATATTITVSWSGGGPGSPRADIREIAPNVSDWRAVTVNGHSHTFTQLPTGCTHQIRIRYANECAGETDYGSYALTGEIIAVDPPDCPDAGNPGGQAQLGHTSNSLEIYVSRSGSPITEFQWRIRLQGGTWDTRDWQTSDAYTFTNLSPNTIYEVGVRSRNAASDCTASVSAWENELHQTSRANVTPCPTPGAPTNLAANDVQNTSFTVSWSNGSNYVSGATSTILQVNGRTWPRQITGTSLALTHLARNTNYKIRVRHQRYQVNSGGGTCDTRAGPWSDELTVRTGGAPCTPPSIPAALLRHAARQTEIDVGYAGGGVHNFYRWRVIDDDGSTVIETSDWIEEGVPATATNLVCNTAYFLQVQALNRCGGSRTETAGGWSPHLPFRTAQCTDTCIAPAVPTLSFTSVTRTSISLSAAAVDNADEYRFRYSNQTTRWQSDNDVTITGLTCNRSYSFQVQARDRCPGGLVAEGDWSGNLAVTTSDCNLSPCAQPIWPPDFGTAASQETMTSAVLSWTPASNATNYTVRIGGSEFPTNTNRVTVSGLQCGTAYRWEVLAINELITCESARTTYRQGNEFRTANCPPPPCPAPSTPSVTAGTPTLDSVSGEISALADADLYQVRWRRSDSGSPLALEEDPQAGRQFTIANLDCGQTYQVEARGVNNCSGGGQVSGEWSSPVSLSTAACQPSCPRPSWSSLAPSATSTQTSVSVSWSAASNATYYLARYRLSGSSVWTTSGRLTSPAFGWHAACNQSFVWQVRAFNTGACLTSFTDWTDGGSIATQGCEAVPCPPPTWPASVPASTSTITRTGFSLTHGAANGATDYRVIARGTGALLGETVATGWRSGRTHSVTGLSCAGTYRISVEARNDCGTGPIGEAPARYLREVTTADCSDCRPPQFLSGINGRATAIGETSAQVNFNAATFPRGTARAEYRVSHGGGETDWLPASNAIALTGLECATEYIWTIQARAVCTLADGREVHSVSSREAGGSFTTAACAQTPCPTPAFLAPLAPRITETELNSLTVSFSPVSNATRYEVRAVSGGSVVSSTSVTAPRSRLPGLLCDTPYLLEVDAIAEGQCLTTRTGWRQLLTARTSECQTCEIPELLDDHVDYSRLSRTGVTLTWRPWENATEYVVELVSGIRSVSESGWTANNSFTFTGLDCNTAYQPRVKARNRCRPANPALTSETPFEAVGVLFRTLHCGGG